MKKLLLVLFSLITVMGTTFAQDQQRDRDRDKGQDRDRLKLREHVLLEDGILYQVQDQKRTRLQTRLNLNNGGVVNPDGSYQMRNGQARQLRNGECLDMDGVKYRNQDRLRERFESKARKQERIEMMKQQRMERQGQQRGHGNRGS